MMYCVERLDLVNTLAPQNTWSMAVIFPSRSFSRIILLNYVVITFFPRRTHSDQFLVTFKEVGRRPPTFGDASVIALELLNSGYEFDEGSIIFNRFRQESFRN